MPTVTMTAVNSQPSGSASPEFVVDATGLPCIDLVVPTTHLTITNLGTLAFNAFESAYTDRACTVFVPGPGKFTLVPGSPLTIQVAQNGDARLGSKINAQDVGPGTYTIRVEFNVSANECQYGTRIKAGFPEAAAVTTAIITAALDPPGALFLAPVLGALVGQYLSYAALWGKGPPPLPDVTSSTPQESMQTWMKILLALTWPVACECVPGTPPPVSPPLPVVSQPPGWPTFPTLPPCLNTDLCSSVQDIKQRVAELQQLLSQHYQFEQLVQRYVLPFAYIRGRRFSTLTATGMQPIERCVGILIEVTQHPADNRTLLGVPEYIFDLGWISVVDADGMIDEIRLTRQATTWLSKLIPTATQVGWGLRDGVTIEISELLAEP